MRICLIIAMLLVGHVASGQVLFLSEKSEKSEPAEPVGLYFWASWCGPCVAPHAIVDEFIEKGLNVKTLDADAPENQALKAKYGIEFLPAFVKLGENGIATAKVQHAMGREQIAAFYGFNVGDPKPNTGESPSKLTATPRVYACGFQGSGTVIAPGQLLTAAHVVRDPYTHKDRSPLCLLFDGDKAVYAKVVKRDDNSDVALLSFEGVETEVIPVAPIEVAENLPLTSHGYPGVGDITRQKASKQLRTIRLSRTVQTPQGPGTNPLIRWASQRFEEGESGGGVVGPTGELTGVIQGNDTGGTGIVVSLEAIRRFLAAN